MSAYAETTKLQPAQEVPERPLPQTAPDADEGSLVRWWRKLIESRKGAADFKEWEAFKEEAKKFGKGDLLDASDIESWKKSHDDGIVVQVNLWRRIRSYYADAIFSNTPNLGFRPNAGRSNEKTLRSASAVEAMVKYVWTECKQQNEARRALKDAWNGNVSVVKTDYDQARGLYRSRWVAGNFIVDPECHGDLSRARWVAEELNLPAARILTDDTFDRDKRLKLYERWKGSFEKVESGGLSQPRTVYYVCSRDGKDPLAGVKELAGEIAPEEGPRKVLFAIVEGFEEFLFNVKDPFPYLDEDEFNYPVLMLEEEPGEWFGSPQWKMLKGLIDAINWLVSFHVASMKKKATTVILTNKAIWKKGEDELSGSAHMEVHGVDGDPSAAAFKLDLGSGDVGQLQSAEALHRWLERLSGFNEVAQGQSSGRKTATEAESLERNTSLVTKGAATSFDNFLNEMVRQVALATLYYVPQFSRVIGPDGSVMTQEVQEIQVMGPTDPMTGAPAMTMQRQAVPVALDPEEAEGLGAVPFEMDGQDFGLRMPDTAVEMPEPMVGEDGALIPGVPVFRNARAGTVLRRGVDFFCGAEVAMDWPTQPLEDVKRDILFSFEAGSTREGYRREQQQAAIGALQLLGPIYQQVGGLDALYELIVAYSESLPFEQNDHYVPPRDLFIQGMQAAMQAQAAPPAPPQPQDGVDPAREREMGLKEWETERRAEMDERRMMADRDERAADRESREKIAARRRGL